MSDQLPPAPEPSPSSVASPFNDRAVIAAFRIRDEARLAEALLRHHGIGAETRPHDELVLRLCSGAFPAGFDVVVAARDAEGAITLLQKVWGDEPEAPQAFARCPACGSLEVTRLRRALLFVVVTVVLLVGSGVTGERDLFALMLAIVGGLLLFARPNRCRACGERWRGGDEPIAAEVAVELPDVPCPRCGSSETEKIGRRREKATTLLVNLLVPPMLFVWPFLPRRRCTACGNQWR